jgi:hypothetical protein
MNDVDKENDNLILLVHTIKKVPVKTGTSINLKMVSYLFLAAFFGADFLAAAFLGAAFFAPDFLAAAFFGAAFLAAPFFAVAMLF